MLYIVADGVEHKWHLGKPKPVVKEDAQYVLVQADGDEVAYIERVFRNIRMCSKPVVRWVGEEAKFIALNL